MRQGGLAVVKVATRPPIWFGETGQYEVTRAVAGLRPKGMLFSPQFLYYLEGIKQDRPGEATGAVPTDGLAILEHIGVAPEGLDPYVVGQFRPPSSEAMAAAQQYRIKSWSSVSRIACRAPCTSLMPVLTLLAARRPLNSEPSGNRLGSETATSNGSLLAAWGRMRCQDPARGGRPHARCVQDP